MKLSQGEVFPLRKALQAGASKIYIEDARQNLLLIIFSYFKGGAVYEGKYLLDTICTTFIYKRLVKIARQEKASYYGCTGKM